MESEKCQCSQYLQYKYNEKSSKTWPELVGLLGDEAAKVIQAEIPNLQIIQIIHPPWALTHDSYDSRVRILVDRFNRVSMPPSIG
ncbi:hypothetical protein R3W88_027770 [Solanum pinnatisectum]|uniref:Uncharacterized protein n=1 Tax=Solanum pinnatisectum TaxID=50273 RepID=A0AAV9LGY6_9SOLN|nr:hypothetical protein R3W88_027770 [Solanum pinnatisectum]